MRIISDFHDFYDGVQAAGQDRTLLYNRRTWHDRPAPLSFPARLLTHVTSGGPTVSTRLVGVAGRVYGCLLVKAWHATEDRLAYCWSIDDVDQFLEANFKKRELESYHASRRLGNRYGWYNQRRRNFEDAFALLAEHRNRHQEMFVEAGSPVFIAKEAERQFVCNQTLWDVAWNAKLAHLDFQRVLDPWQCFQEIAHWLGNCAVPLKPIPVIDDETMLAAKGFDRFSFRKDKARS